jgi:hypothetical protein
MRELIDHIAKNKYASLFAPGERNHELRVVYMCIRAAAHTDADKLVIKSNQFFWSKGDKPISHFPRRNFLLDLILGKYARPIPTSSYSTTFLKVLERDSVLRRYLRVVSESPDEMIVSMGSN